MPRRFAVRKLKTNSNLAGCSHKIAPIESDNAWAETPSKRVTLADPSSQ
jgi:hypothetical protein